MSRRFHFSQIESPIDPPESKTYTLTVCVACREEVDFKSAGDETLVWCDSCQSLEPDTVEVEYDENDEEVA